ncbi:MAG: septum formation initiator family protein [Verrucomicrobiota bacterium]|jgi:cell division protein FtsB
MAKNRKSQSAAIHFGPVLKVVLLCFLFGGSAVGYVWQKGQIYQLGQQIRQRESQLAQMKDTNQKLRDQLAMLRSPSMLDRRARELNLGLAPAQPSQIWRLPEPSPAVPAATNSASDDDARLTAEAAP